MYLGMVPLAMPLHELTTAAVWCTVTREALVDAGLDASEIPGALHGAEHAMIGMLPLFAMCDRNDLGGLSTSVHPDTGQPTIVVHDALSGGSGCSARGFDAAVEWIRATAQAIAACPCIHGCPRCVQSPKCGNNNEPLSKAGALILLNLILHDWAGPRR